MVEVYHCRQSIQPAERLVKSFHGKPPRIYTFHCRIASAKQNREWKWKRLSNSCSNNPCGRCSLWPPHAPEPAEFLPKLCWTTMKKRRSKHQTFFCPFVSNVRSRRNKIRPNLADDRLFPVRQFAAFLVHIPGDAGLNLSQGHCPLYLLTCCIAA